MEVVSDFLCLIKGLDDLIFTSAAEGGAFFLSSSCLSDDMLSSFALLSKSPCWFCRDEFDDDDENGRLAD